MLKPELISKYLEKYGYEKAVPCVGVEGRIRNTYYDGDIEFNTYVVHISWYVDIMCKDLRIVNCVYTESLEIPTLVYRVEYEYGDV